MHLTMPSGNDMIEFTASDSRGPVVVRRPASGGEALAWLAENRARIESVLKLHGGVLLRDLGLTAVSDFNRAVQVFDADLLDYVHRSTPRSKVGGRIFTATEYPADRSIPLHNENSYTDTWPSRIYFFCLVVPEYGGETPTADARKVYRRIDPDIRARFEQDGVLYVRNFTDGIDLHWQDVFQTEDRAEVERYCTAHGIAFEWRDSGPVLRTRQQRQATLVHPVKGESVWFNQAHLFHISALGTHEQDLLVDTLGAENVPRNAFYGDGSPIEADVLAHIRDAYAQERTAFAWKRGDILLLDNLLFAHGRNPFSGNRKIVVAMA